MYKLPVNLCEVSRNKVEKPEGFSKDEVMFHLQWKIPFGTLILIIICTGKEKFIFVPFVSGGLKSIVLKYSSVSELCVNVVLNYRV